MTDSPFELLERYRRVDNMRSTDKIKENILMCYVLVGEYLVGEQAQPHLLDFVRAILRRENLITQKISMMLADWTADDETELISISTEYHKILDKIVEERTPKK